MLPIELQNPPYVLVKWVENCKQTFNSTNKISKFRPDKVHYDLLGPTLVNSNKKIRFYVVFVYDYSRLFTWLYLLKRKSKISKVG